MFGVKTTKGWLKAATGTVFFTFSPKPEFPFRSADGAAQVASDWLAGDEYTVVPQFKETSGVET